METGALYFLLVSYCNSSIIGIIKLSIDLYQLKKKKDFDAKYCICNPKSEVSLKILIANTCHMLAYLHGEERLASKTNFESVHKRWSHCGKRH